MSMTTRPVDQEHTRRRAPAAAGEEGRRDSLPLAIDVSIERHPDPLSGGMSHEDAAVPQRLRRILRASLNHWGRSDLADTAELVLTELVTNALVHTTGPGIRVRVSAQGAHLRIEVNDFSPGGRLPRPAEPYAEHGRGLLIVDALAEKWGVSDDRTNVWCTLPLTEGTSQMPPAVHPERVPGQVDL